MTPEAQRIAIAEACGWKHDWGDFYHMPDRPSTCHKSNIPDYLNDLNAMHQAEKVLTFHQWNGYVDNIIDSWPAPMFTAPYRGYEVCHAPAAQRAEAFLRTLGLWKDET